MFILSSLFITLTKQSTSERFHLNSWSNAENRTKILSDKSVAPTDRSAGTVRRKKAIVVRIRRRWGPSKNKLCKKYEFINVKRRFIQWWFTDPKIPSYLGAILNVQNFNLRMESINGKLRIYIQSIPLKLNRHAPQKKITRFQHEHKNNYRWE